MTYKKKCANCDIQFTKPPRASLNQWAHRKFCSPTCHRQMKFLIAKEKPERTCIYCLRSLPVESFRNRRNGLPLSYCKECDLVKGRIRYDLNIRQLGKTKPRNEARVWVPSEKNRARAKVNTEIRAGRLQRNGCEVCGGVAHAHHKDYSKPLDVRWLCPKHHGMEHWRPVNTPIAQAIRNRT